MSEQWLADNIGKEEMMAVDDKKREQRSKLIAWTIAVIAVSLFVFSLYMGAGTQ